MEIDQDINCPKRLLDRFNNRCIVDNSCVKNNCNITGMELTGHYWSESWSWIATLVLWFIIIVIFSWLILYSIKPAWIINSDTGELDTAKLLLASVIIGVVVIVIIWLFFCLCSGRFCNW